MDECNDYAVFLLELAAFASLLNTGLLTLLVVWPWSGRRDLQRRPPGCRSVRAEAADHPNPTDT